MGRKSGKLLSSLKGHVDKVISLAFSPDGIHLVSGSDDGTLSVGFEITRGPSSC